MFLDVLNSTIFVSFHIIIYSCFNDEIAHRKNVFISVMNDNPDEVEESENAQHLREVLWSQYLLLSFLYDPVVVFAVTGLKWPIFAGAEHDQGSIRPD